MKTALTIVGVTLFVVIIAVAGVYSWMMLTTPPPSDKLNAPPEFVARAQPKPKPQPAKPAQPAPSQTRERPNPAPESTVPPASPNPVDPLPPPGAQTTEPVERSTAPVPVREPPPAEREAPIPETDVSDMVETMEDKLYELAIGQSVDEVIAIMGAEGMPPADGGEFVPPGWYTLRWTEPGGASITATFDQDDLLTYVVPFKVPGAFEWMNDNLNYSIVTWINDNLETSNLPVRVPAVQIAAVLQNQYQFQAGLVMQGGQVTGSIGGTYYVGDGATTYLPGDTRPYIRAMEGSYQFYAPNGAQVGNTFALSEY